MSLRDTILTKEQRERYTRQLLLKEIGEEGQKKLISSKVLVIGVGGLGSPIVIYLAAAGIGTIGIADNDTVELSNLQRQIIHSSADIDKPKVTSAKEKLKALNPEVEVITYYERITQSNITKLISDYDFVLDATDNFESKFLINDACVAVNKPFSHGGIYGFMGQTLTYLPGFACYRCIFEEPPENRKSRNDARHSQHGGLPVIGVTPGIIGIIQATEAIKYLLGTGNLLTNTLLTVDLLTMEFRKIEIEKNPDCPACGKVTAKDL